ncbi:cell division protein FtsK [Campylobacter pinnipediorum subsp. caledonicus]|uniref:FtsK/SpoIIIE family DNA translocase n=1 Tax=Campylobacter pinnipediorum TaxID=1965231 RepID=UPI0009CCF252|nr:DNA translocase FtsK [Campylobacter pinnipediorum]OPA72125.1 cell division protein FtsK [Campylobacter pinnipediorum subsp. caledonicus]
MCFLVYFGLSTFFPTADFVGIVGKNLGKWNLKLFGLVSYVYPFILICIVSFKFYKIKKIDIEFLEFTFGLILFFFAILMFQAMGFSGANSGLIGSAINDTLRSFIGKIGSFIITIGIFIMSLALIFRDNILVLIKKSFIDPTKNVFKSQKYHKELEYKDNNKSKTKIKKNIIDTQIIQDDDIVETEHIEETKENKKEDKTNINQEKTQEEIQKTQKQDTKNSKVEILSEVVENKKLLDELEKGKIEKPKDFTLPSLKFLADPPKRSSGVNEAEIDQKISDLLDKLHKFKIDGDVVRTYTGPIVTTFEFKPAPHIKVSKILTLQDDLAMALKAQTIRIQAPVPGKDVVGIEVPNKNTETIYLKEILDSEIYKNASSPLTMALGKDIVGAPFITDLKKLPHLLIAGTTGSGKSVGINAMLLSLLYRNSPQTLRLMMIDPKMLEFSIYNDIPHLLTPVITQAKQAITALSNMVAEMERRYTVMSHTRTKNIESYNEKMKKEGGEQFPYIVVIIDELADLMMTSGKDVELYIGRLAQMARASGIHLIVATQRPSVDVVTGLIKANLPSRISYRVGQKIDSKVIIDQMGAESLLGRGDMLFTPPGSPGIIRLHAPFTSEKEIETIVEFLKSQQSVMYDERFLQESGSNSSDTQANDGVVAGELDPLFESAKEIILTEQKTSISYLQRRLGVGYNRSANIIEQMEKMGILSSVNSKGQREIL